MSQIRLNIKIYAIEDELYVARKYFRPTNPEKGSVDASIKAIFEGAGLEKWEAYQREDNHYPIPMALPPCGAPMVGANCDAILQPDGKWLDGKGRLHDSPEYFEDAVREYVVEQITAIFDNGGWPEGEPA